MEKLLGSLVKQFANSAAVLEMYAEMITALRDQNNLLIAQVESSPKTHTRKDTVAYQSSDEQDTRPLINLLIEENDMLNLKIAHLCGEIARLQETLQGV